MPATGGRPRRSRPTSWLLVAVFSVGALSTSACRADSTDVAEAVTEREALDALGTVRLLASEQTGTAMDQVCDLSLDRCNGMSGAIREHPEAAPGPDLPAPEIRCSRAVGDGAWMLVIDGVDGYGRSYTSQFVLVRNDRDDVVPLREPAFWLGIAYHGSKVTGSTGWTAAYHPQEGVDGDAQTQKALQLARRACDPE